MRPLFLASALALGLTPAVQAAGGGEEKAPTKPKCKAGEVYDKKSKSCVVAREGALDTEGFYQNVRQLSHAGRYAEAQEILALMPQEDDRTLTYLGFTNRKLGRDRVAMDYYARALALNPDNILARSYLGQGLVERGEIKGALAQLRAIRAAGGQGTWAEASLRQAIATGRTYSY